MCYIPYLPTTSEQWACLTSRDKKALTLILKFELGHGNFLKNILFHSYFGSLVIIWWQYIHNILSTLPKKSSDAQFCSNYGGFLFFFRPGAGLTNQFTSGIPIANLNVWTLTPYCFVSLASLVDWSTAACLSVHTTQMTLIKIISRDTVVERQDARRTLT